MNKSTFVAQFKKTLLLFYGKTFRSVTWFSPTKITFWEWSFRFLLTYLTRFAKTLMLPRQATMLCLMRSTAEGTLLFCDRKTTLIKEPRQSSTPFRKIPTKFKVQSRLLMSLSRLPMQTLLLCNKHCLEFKIQKTLSL